MLFQGLLVDTVYLDAIGCTHSGNASDSLPLKANTAISAETSMHPNGKTLPMRAICLSSLKFCRQSGASVFRIAHFCLQPDGILQQHGPNAITAGTGI